MYFYHKSFVNFKQLYGKHAKFTLSPIFLDIVKITNNIVNHIDLYEDCPFKIPIL